MNINMNAYILRLHKYYLLEFIIEYYNIIYFYKEY